MCDIGGEIFSERADNWQTFTATNFRRNKLTGKMEFITEQLDACPLHATGPTREAPEPRFATNEEVKQIAEVNESPKERKARLDAAKGLHDLREGKR